MGGRVVMGLMGILGGFLRWIRVLRGSFEGSSGGMGRVSFSSERYRIWQT